MKYIKITVYVMMILGLLPAVAPVGAAPEGEHVQPPQTSVAGTANSIRHDASLQSHDASLESGGYSVGAAVRPDLSNGGPGFAQAAGGSRNALLFALWIGLGAALFGAALFISIFGMFFGGKEPQSAHATICKDVKINDKTRAS